MRQLISTEWQIHRGFWLATLGCAICLYTAIGLTYAYASSVIG